MDRHALKWIRHIQKRYALYLIIITGTLAVMGNWYRNHLDKVTQDGNRTFPSLASQLNHRDGVLTLSWRNIWNIFPSNWQVNLTSLTPPPPAIQVRISACRAISQFGTDAVPLVLSKVTDPDDTLAQTAMHGLLNIGYSDEQTWDVLSDMLFDQARSLPTRRMALIALIGLHHEEPKCFSALERLNRTDQPLIHSLDPKANYNLLAARKPASPVLAREQKALDHVKKNLSRPFISALLRNKAPGFEHIAYYLGSAPSHSLFRNGGTFLPAFPAVQNQENGMISRLIKDQLIQENQSPDLFIATGTHASPKIRELAIQFYSPRFAVTPEIIQTLLSLTKHEDRNVVIMALSYLNWSEAIPAEMIPADLADQLVSVIEKKDAGVTSLVLTLMQHLDAALSVEWTAILSSMIDEAFRDPEPANPGKTSHLLELTHRMGVSLSPTQLEMILPWTDHPDPRLRKQALATYIRFHSGSFSDLMDAVLSRSFFTNFEKDPEIDKQISDYLQRSETNRMEAETRIIQLHKEIQKTAKTLTDYRNASTKETLPPVSMERTLEQNCRKRSWLFATTAASLKDRPVIMEILRSSPLEHLNPNRIEDAMVLYQIKSDLQVVAAVIQSLLRSNNQLTPKISDLISNVGKEAIPLIAPLLQHDQRTMRVQTFKLITSMLPDKQSHLPYLKAASKDADRQTIWQLKAWSEQTSQ